MFLVGITGGIATGKSLACDFFKKKKIEIVDADEISRSLQEVGEKGYEEVVKAFGKDVLKPNKELDKALDWKSISALTNVSLKKNINFVNIVFI